MRCRLHIILAIFLCTAPVAAAENPYQSVIVKTTLKRPTHTRLIPVQTGTVKDPETGDTIPVFEDQEVVEFVDNTDLVLDLPFKTYGQNIVSLGEDITYRMHDVSLAGRAVVAKVDYLKTDVDIVDKFTGNLGTPWEDVKKKLDVKAHWTLTKQDALATYTAGGVKIPYVGPDMLDVVPFCKWEGQEKSPI